MGKVCKKMQGDGRVYGNIVSSLEIFPQSRQFALCCAPPLALEKLGYTNRKFVPRGVCYFYTRVVYTVIRSNYLVKNFPADRPQQNTTRSLGGDTKEAC